jgi:hypothetical protein
MESKTSIPPKFEKKNLAKFSKIWNKYELEILISFLIM